MKQYHHHRDHDGSGAIGGGGGGSGTGGVGGVSGSSRKEKRQYKKRKHKLQKEKGGNALHSSSVGGSGGGIGGYASGTSSHHSLHHPHHAGNMLLKKEHSDPVHVRQILGILHKKFTKSTTTTTPAVRAAVGERPNVDLILGSGIIEPMMSSDEDDFNGNNAPGSESEDEGLYSFKRNRNCNYHKVSPCFIRVYCVGINI